MPVSDKYPRAVIFILIVLPCGLVSYYGLFLDNTVLPIKWLNTLYKYTCFIGLIISIVFLYLIHNLKGVKKYSEKNSIERNIYNITNKHTEINNNTTNVKNEYSINACAKINRTTQMDENDKENIKDNTNKRLYQNMLNRIEDNYNIYLFESEYNLENIFEALSKYFEGDIGSFKALCNLEPINESKRLYFKEDISDLYRLLIELLDLNCIKGSSSKYITDLINYYIRSINNLASNKFSEAKSEKRDNEATYINFLNKSKIISTINSNRIQ